MLNSATGLEIGYDDEELKRLVELLESPVGTIQMWLRRVRFVSRVGKVKKTSRLETWSGRKMLKSQRDDIELIQRAREVLGNVGSVRLGGVPPNGGGAFWRLMDALKGVREVHVEGRALIANTKLLEWVCGLQELQELSVTASTTCVDFQEPPEPWNEEQMQVKLRSGKTTSVNLLEIGGPDGVGVLCWLLAQSQVPRVKSLKIGSPVKGWWDDKGQDGYPQLMKRFFKACGAGIEHMHITLPVGDSGDFPEPVGFDNCDGLHSIHIETLRVGPPTNADNDQRRTLELLLEKLFIKSSVGPQVNSVALTVQLDPHSRKLLTFFGIPDVTLFQKFEWGRVPEILERAWLGPRQGNQCQNYVVGAAGSGNNWSVHSANANRSQAVWARKELVLIIQGGWKYGRESLVDTLRRGVFSAFDERVEFSVRFDAEDDQPRGCCL